MNTMNTIEDLSNFKFPASYVYCDIPENMNTTGETIEFAFKTIQLDSPQEMLDHYNQDAFGRWLVPELNMVMPNKCFNVTS